MEDAVRTPAPEDAVGRYFQEFLPGIFGRLLIADIESLTTCFAIDVTDGQDPPWRVSVERGRLVRVGHHGDEPLCIFHLDGATLLEVVSARVPPAEAFFAMQIELDGDLELGLKLSTVLAPFFEGFPFHG